MTATAYTTVFGPWLYVAGLLAAMLFGALVAAASMRWFDGRSAWWGLMGPLGLACWLFVLFVLSTLGGR